MNREGVIYELTDEQLDRVEGKPGIAETFEQMKDKFAETVSDISRLDGYLRGRAEEAVKRGKGANRDLSNCGSRSDAA